MKKNKNTIYCPNGCGERFKISFKNKPKGMLVHLSTCGKNKPLFDKKKLDKILEKKYG